MKKFKIFCIADIAGLAVLEAVVTVLHFVRRAEGDGLPWWVFVLPAAIFVTISAVGLCVYMRVKSAFEENFERKLSASDFDVQRRYRLNDGVDVCIDFESKRFACNLLYKDIVPFSRIANCRTELSKYTGRRTLLCVVMSLRCGEAKDDIEDDIEIFDSVTLFHAVLPVEIDELTDDLPNRFPELQIAFDLQKDMDKIYEINVQDGVNAVVVEEPTESDWTQPSDFYEQHYTKPPHGDL